MMKRLVGRVGQLAGLTLALVTVAAACTGEAGAGTGAGGAVDRRTDPATLELVRGQSTDAILLFAGDHLERQYGDRVAATTGDVTFRVRSVREFSLGPVQSDAFLIERIDAAANALPGWGSVRGTDAGFPGELLNTGWVSALDDGGVVFAWALLPEVVRFDANGREVWRSLRDSPVPVEPPVLVREGSSIRPDFTEIQHGIATGPDGNVYVLTGATSDSVRLDVLDSSGTFIETGWLPRGRDILVDREGAVLLGREKVAGNRRVAFENFDLPALDGAGRIRLSDYEERVVVINVWASWCGPCRLEMPSLDSLAAEIGDHDVVILGLNDDEDPEAARRFVKSIGGVNYPLATGGGNLRERFGIFGLPHTVVLDRQHRSVDEVRGFGATIEPIMDAIETALSDSTRFP